MSTPWLLAQLQQGTEAVGNFIAFVACTFPSNSVLWNLVFDLDQVQRCFLYVVYCRHNSWADCKFYIMDCSVEFFF